MISVASLFDSLSALSSNKSEAFGEQPVLIYGAGNTGKAVAKYLFSQGLIISAFIDKNATNTTSCNGIPIFTLNEAFEKYGEKCSVLIAIHNRGVDIPPLMELIKNIGFHNCFTMFDYARIFNQDSSFRYFLTDPLRLSSECDGAEKFFSLLADENSKSLYLNLLKFRLLGDYQSCPSPNPEDQYSPSDIPRWVNPLRLIDCGAYNGDSIRLFKAYQYDIEMLIALEPDLKNYQSLIGGQLHSGGLYLPCGASDFAKVVKFDANAGEGSRVSDDGSLAIQMVSIDQALPSVAPNLIKMDIEGGEREAILGAQETIKKYKPGLAISAYHLPADLWQLGLLISEIEPEYHFYLRSHAYSSFDTVLYAVPR